MKTYEKYKPSGIDWIGDIPEHWTLRKYKFLYRSNMGTTLLKSDVLEEGTIPVYSATESDILFGYVNEADVILEKGDLVIPARGNSIGHVTKVPGLATCTQTTIYSKRNSDSIQEDFSHYYLTGLREVLFQFDRTAIPQITVGQVKENIIVVPPLMEQIHIVDYLDKETARIDQLVEKKKRLIELLKEERLAIINQAVTRGLDPNAKLKPSNLEWLGDIPEHWEVKKLKFISKIKYGLGQPPNEKEDGLPLLRATNVERGKIVEKDLIFVDPDDIPYERDPVLEKDDILVVRSGAYTADSAIVPAKYAGAIAGYDMIVRVFAALPEFIAYCLLSNYLLVNQLYLEKLRAAQPHLNKEELGESLIVLPTADEQSQIVKYLDLTCEKIEATIAKVEKEIDLQNEYRTALISELVTGKIRIT